MSFETQTFGDDEGVLHEVMVIDLMEDEPAEVFLSLEDPGTDQAVITALTPARSREVAYALMAAAADADRINAERGSS